VYDTKYFLWTTTRPSGQKVAVFSKEICTDLLHPHTNTKTSRTSISNTHTPLSFHIRVIYKLVIVPKGISTKLHTLTMVSCMAGLSRYSLAFAAA
jgi:hypothetical protein